MSIEHGSYVDKMELLQDLPHYLDVDYKTREKFKKFLENTKGIDLLDRDNGKEPILESGNSTYHVSYADGSCGFESKSYTDWKCPSCGWFVGELYSGYGMWHIQCETSYCAKCGQKIDWSLPKEEEKRRYEEFKAKEREEWEKKNGTKLDNMWESKRKKYGMLSEEGA